MLKSEGVWGMLDELRGERFRGSWEGRRLWQSKGCSEEVVGSGWCCKCVEVVEVVEEEMEAR